MTIGVFFQFISDRQTEFCPAINYEKQSIKKYNYTVVIVEEGTFDRTVLTHKVNLFDLNAKYANALYLKEVFQYIDTPWHTRGPYALQLQMKLTWILASLKLNVSFDRFFIDAYAAHEVARRPYNVLVPIHLGQPRKRFA